MVIIDTNTWAPVFDCNNIKHCEFAAVFAYVMSNKASMAWGGSYYLKELRKASKYLGVHLELTKGGRAIRFDDKKVDVETDGANAKCRHKDFDDAHLIGLQIVSKASVIVSGDQRAYPFFKRKTLYPKRHCLPKIYCKSGNAPLLGK